MEITYLGHAGFYVETEATVIIMDPWLSRYGAFDSSWFQYPPNAHMAAIVLEQFEASSKDKYIYISHEHKDHFDIEFLKSIQTRNFKIILANFQHSVVHETLDQLGYQCQQIITLNDDESLTLQDGWLKLFLVDAELDCDSAILVKTNSGCFLNVNDCKIYDRLTAIAEQYGPIHAFASQFSGAIWHPVCYEFSKTRYEAISNQKKFNKFQAVCQSIEIINPLVFLPSAGPPCFLDPILMPINFAETSIFPRAPVFIQYLDEHCNAAHTRWPEIMPGDVLDAKSGQFIHWIKNRVLDSQFKEIVEKYAEEYQTYFQQREQENKKISPKAVFFALKEELETKMKAMKIVGVEISTCLYWVITEYPNHMLQINFKDKTITITDHMVAPTNFWRITAPAWQVNKVLSKEINWPDFVLTFRVKLKRIPDIYNEMIHGFIALDACEIGPFCKMVNKFHAQKERTVIEVDGKQYSILRWCPHLGGDLSQGWVEDGYWVCPRHHWHFDVCHQAGQCLTSSETIKAKVLNNDVHPPSSCGKSAEKEPE